MEFRTRLVPGSQFLKNMPAVLLTFGTLAAMAGAEDRTPAHHPEPSAAPDVSATPNFRRHVLPLLGRLGCNGRTCHGSFQGQGGFRLSLFGYDLAADHQALTEGDEPRVNRVDPAESLILYKPTHGDEHGGGQRFAAGGWQYDLLRRWVETGAHGVREGDPELVKLEILPREMVLAETAQRRPLPSLDFPGYGAVVSKERPGPPDLPPFVGIPKTPQVAGVLGVEYAPFNTQSTPRAGQPFTVRGLTLGRGLTQDKLERRGLLLSQPGHRRPQGIPHPHRPPRRPRPLWNGDSGSLCRDIAR